MKSATIKLECRLLTAMTLLLCSQLTGFAQTASVAVLHNFVGGDADGATPTAPIVKGADGNYYGTTEYGGTADKGTFYRMSPSGGVTVLHSFGSVPNDGLSPVGPPILASDGSFYGTTAEGGTGSNGGTVYKVTAAGDLTILHNFGAAHTKGIDPAGGLVQARDGNLYGVTLFGGSNFLSGTLFSVSTAGVFTTWHVFPSGSFPAAHPTMGRDGALYGVTVQGGTANAGVIYKLIPGHNFTVVHSFSGSDGGYPNGPLLLGADGLLYGTTSADANDGQNPHGTVFQYTPGGSLNVIHAFPSTPPVDINPIGPLVQAPSGVFFGVTRASGQGQDSMFSFTNSSDFKNIFLFTKADIYAPFLSNVRADGAIYGLSTAGGTDQRGTAFLVSNATSEAAAYFLISSPRNVTTGTPFNFTVTALDQSGNPATGYSGTVQFYSNTSHISLPANSTLTNGAGTFSATVTANVSCKISAIDVANASVHGTSVLVTSGP